MAASGALSEAVGAGVGGVLTPRAVPPKSLAEYATDCKLSSEYLELLLTALGLDADESLEVVALVPIQGADNLIGELKKEGVAISLGDQGRMRAFLRKVREAYDQIEQDKAKPKAAITVDGLQPPEAVGKTPGGGEKRKKSDVLDQLDDGTYDDLDPEARKQMRTRHRDVTGGNPLPAARPTAPQLAALKSRVESGEAPYTDFAVFGPYGNRLSKIRKFEAQVFVDGELKTRILRGPSNFESWSACWAVFRSAMIMLDLASPQVLDDYHEGIRQLTALFPSAWGIIFTADEIMRSEQWDILNEIYTDEGSGDATYPWNKVLAASAFGKATGDVRHWWDTHVVFPVQSSGGAGARIKVADIEGTANLPTEDGRFGWVPGNGRGAGGGKRAKSKAAARPMSFAKCQAWNNGGCAKTGPCPNGEKHACTTCGGTHPAVRCWHGQSNKGKGKGGASGKSGGGKGKKGKDKNPSK